jgi:hypothetical protein
MRIHDFGFETLYKNRPEELEHAEYYQPRYDMRFVNGAWAFFVAETHAWFDTVNKKAVNQVTTLSPEEGFSDSREALARYEQQVLQRASEGFVHSFALDLNEPGPRYRRIEPTKKSP